LFDQLPAMMSIFDNVNNLDELLEIFPKMSLVTQDLIGKPTAPMLVLSGVLDTQVPISDTYRLLSAGDVPKTGWINPHGGHLGRQKGVWPDPVMFKEVIVPWIVHALDVEPPTK
jgi:esterase FrsA